MTTPTVTLTPHDLRTLVCLVSRLALLRGFVSPSQEPDAFTLLHEAVYDVADGQLGRALVRADTFNRSATARRLGLTIPELVLAPVRELLARLMEADHADSN